MGSRHTIRLLFALALFLPGTALAATVTITVANARLSPPTMSIPCSPTRRSMPITPPSGCSETTSIPTTSRSPSISSATPRHRPRPHPDQRHRHVQHLQHRALRFQRSLRTAHRRHADRHRHRPGPARQRPGCRSSFPRSPRPAVHHHHRTQRVHRRQRRRHLHLHPRRRLHRRR